MRYTRESRARSFCLPLAAMFIMAFYLYSMGVSKELIGLREGVFGAALIIALYVALAEIIFCRHGLLDFVRQEWLLVTIPMLLASYTLFWDLVDLPYYSHFDFTFNSLFASQLLAGGLEGGWAWGYVPAPVLGLLPEVLGIVIGGSDPFGFRVGNSLFNISSVFAVYLLGRTYRNPRVGFWAAIILAGNISFIHFSRQQSNGASATAALWALTVFALALQYRRIGLWLWLGIVSGCAFYLWPVARVGVAAVGLCYMLVCVRYPLTQLRRLYLPGAALIGFAVMIAPLIPVWEANPRLLWARAYESLTVVAATSPWYVSLVEHPTIRLFFKSLGWVFSEMDMSMQGPRIWPGFDSSEAVLIACGMVVLAIEGASYNILIGIFLMITLLVCGAWASGPPWYTRLLPSAPAFALVAARCLEGLHNLSARGGRTFFLSAFWGLSALLIWTSPIENFSRYWDRNLSPDRNFEPNLNATIGRTIYELGPDYQYIVLARGYYQWEIRHHGSLGEMLPYIMNRRMRDVYDVYEALPVPDGEPTVFIVQLAREGIDVPAIKSAHPDARVEDLKAFNGSRVAIAVFVNDRG